LLHLYVKKDLSQQQRTHITNADQTTIK